MRVSLLAVCLAALPGVGIAAGSARAAKAPYFIGGNHEVEVVKDLAYRDGKDADPVKHKLDLYLPKGHKDYPVILFVHGGEWKRGDKKYFGGVGQTAARNGIGAVIVNYRLSPKVKHPGHVQDLARAFAWTRQHIAKYGGKPGEIFLCGHSAGGHLAALLATDETYLKAEKLNLSHIKGVIGVSGVYTLAPFNGSASVFGTDKNDLKKASPVNHVKRDHPPFLILYAAKDIPTFDKMAEDFCKGLKSCMCEANSIRLEDRNHTTILTRANKNEADPLMQAVLKFIAKHSSLKLMEKKE